MSSNKWMTALREWNEKHNNKSTWCIPKKGTADYDKVRQMMNPAAQAPPAKPSRSKRQTSSAPPAAPAEPGYWVRDENGKRKWVKAGSGIKEV